MTKTYVQIGGQTVDGSLAPADRRFRDAWQLSGDAVSVDMEKARNIQRDRIRQARKEKFLAADSAWFLADETADAAKKAEVIARKQKLRDAPQDARIDSAATPDALAALTLDVLIA